MEVNVSIYSTSTCCCRCSYCFISKNPALIELDKYLDEASKGTYYIDLLKEYVGEDIKNVTSLEIWGGEPTLHLDRSYNFITQLYQNSARFSHIFFSSSYYSDNFIDAFQGILHHLGTMSDREFILQSQISIDGPECITDPYRGKGVTARLIENFNKAIKLDIPNNVKVKFSLKPTLSLETLKFFLDKEFIKEYFKFFEDNFIDKINNLNNDKIMKMRAGLPNLASPANYTKEDGMMFAEVERLLAEVEKENEEQHFLKYYRILRLFYRGKVKIPHEGYVFRGGFCGSGRGMIGLLPFGKACGCHRDFTDFLESYRKASRYDLQEKVIRQDGLKDTAINAKILVYNSVEDMYRHRERMSNFYDKPTTVMITSMMATIKLLALSGQIDLKYADDDEARIAAYRLMNTKTNCMDDSISITGTCSGIPISLFKLFLNGAIDYLFDE